MKVSTPIVLASLASTGLAAHQARHARFHDASAKREAELVEITKRLAKEDPTLVKRCGETINSGQWGSFPNCWGACAGSAECGGGASGSVAAPAPAAAASSPAPAADSPAAASTPAAVQVNNDAKVQASSAPAAAASSAAPSSSSSSSSSGSSSSTGKVGLAYNDPSLLSGWLSGDAAWAYNWGFQAGNGFPSKLNYVPMFHDNSQLTNFAKESFDGYDYLLSLNEPDMSVADGGSALSPSAACTAHNSAFANLQSKQISSPAVSSSGTSGQGLDWLKQFKAACSNAKVDFVPLHWYGGGGSGASQGAAFLSYLETAKSTVNDLYPGKQIWWTEIAATPVTDASVNADFLSAIMSTLGSDSSVGRVAPFMVGSGGALGTSSPNAAGKVLIGL